MPAKHHRSRLSQPAVVPAVTPRWSATNSDLRVGRIELPGGTVTNVLADPLIDSDLLERAASEAARQNKTLRAYLKEAVEEKLWRDWPRGRS